MEDYVTKTIIVGIISWTTAFLLARRIFSKCSFDFCNRIVSTIHATLAVTLASLSVEDWRCPICPMTSKSSHKQCITELVAALWVSEMSSPFLHLREHLKELGYRDSPLNLVVDFLFAAIFTIARMLAGPYVTYVTLSASNPLLIKAMALGLQLVSAFWFFKIVRMVKYKVTKISTYEKDIKHNIRRKTT
ncbi:hypothetical protein TanjilG_31022 [Lupinus angustifolius]|uniref:TLC domain-containing protein n=1 Tax=Lupinus angustifolius TaxID=3871 RepID=A0A1J7HP50_LUPAN|nr:hypothetical protein TanjilG_31022 [Lupinus angustifolius]